MPPSQTMENGSSNNNHGNLVAAADLIRQLDSAFSDMNTSVVEGARDAEDARKNARRAAELARRFASGKNPTTTLDEWEAEEAEATGFTRQLQPPPAPVPPQHHHHHNNDHVTSTPRKSPRQAHNNINGETPLSNARSNRLNKNAERLAQQHAEDLLQVTLELERTKQQLEEEQMTHDETKSALQQTRAKNHQLETEMEKLLNDMETAREHNGRRLDTVEDDLHRAQERILQAEEDADMAYDIAKEKDAERAKMEEWLHRALEEIQGLRDYIASSSQQGAAAPPVEEVEEKEEDYVTPRNATGRRVHFEDEAPSSVSSSRNPPSTGRSAIVAAGRQLLQQNRTTSTSEESAQRRRRLRDRLQGLEDLTTRSAPAKSNSLGQAVEALDVCRKAAQILKESGYRLNLAGRWWNPVSDEVDHHAELHLETLARHYTAAVEVGDSY